MANDPLFASIGTKTDSIDVRLSYRIIELFSEGLYSSPNKAIEELVANSFDAGAQQVHVLLSPDLHDQNATIVVIDDGEGMDQDGLKRHWLIGFSNKRDLSETPRKRKQIGKFGIGKLATYVLANRLTHICKHGARYFSTSMDYRNIHKGVDSEVEPRAPIRIDVRELTADEAEKSIEQWAETVSFKSSGLTLFGEDSPESWTVSIMSSLKKKVHEMKPGLLKWVLRTALPLRPDFGIWLDGEKLASSKDDQGLIRRWVLGKDLKELPRPSPKGITDWENVSVDISDENRFGFNVPELGHITGYAEVYKDLLTTGKSEEIGRSHGFFVYVYGRLLNVTDGHFGISPNELRHGTFGRFRLVVNIDGLDDGLRSNRETIGEGALLETAQDVLRSIFNATRPTIERYDEDEEPGAKLSRKLAESPASLSRRPIVALARAVAEGEYESRYLIVPEHKSREDREAFLECLESRTRTSEQFVTTVSDDFEGSTDDGFVRFDTESGTLQLNRWHPFVATFHEEFVHKRWGLPLELLAMAEILAEAHLHSIGVRPEKIREYLSERDQLLRYFANESGRQSALSVANALLNSRNSRDRLEQCLCSAFRSLGFDVTPMGKRGEPDGVAAAHLSADDHGTPKRYMVSLEAKSKDEVGQKVTAKDVNIAAVVQHRNEFKCDHALVAGPAFPTSQGYNSALGKSILDDRNKTKALGEVRSITLITLTDLARLVRLRPIKHLGLRKIRELFQNCGLPEECRDWVNSVQVTSVENPPYREIVETIQVLQKKFKKAPVNYAALRIELSHLQIPVIYETDDELFQLCKAMAQMAPGAIFARPETVELDQSAENVIAAIETALQEYPPNEIL